MARKKKAKKKGGLLMLLGVAFILAAVILVVHNVREADSAYEASMEVLPELQEHIDEEVAKDWDEEYSENKEMPRVEIDGKYYVGRLDIPSIDLSLPVMDEWSYDNLKIAPCRYDGNVYQGDLIIAGHNYARHFSPIKNLPEGAEVTFTDMDGAVFTYTVSEIEIVDPYDIEKMYSGDWDLTLFTCTYGGQNRHAVRCTIQKYPYEQ